MIANYEPDDVYAAREAYLLAKRERIAAAAKAQPAMPSPVPLPPVATPAPMMPPINPFLSLMQRR